MINAKDTRRRVRSSRHHTPVIVSLMLIIVAVLTAGGPALLPTAASAETTAASPADVSLRIGTFNAQFLPDLAVAPPGQCEWGQGVLGVDVEYCDTGRVQVYDGTKLAQSQTSLQLVIRAPGISIESTRLAGYLRQYSAGIWEGSRIGESLSSGDFDVDGIGDLAVGLPGFEDAKGLVHIRYGERFPTGSTIGFDGPSGLNQKSAAGQTKVAGARFGATVRTVRSSTTSLAWTSGWARASASRAQPGSAHNHAGQLMNRTALGPVSDVAVSLDVVWCSQTVAPYQ